MVWPMDVEVDIDKLRTYKITFSLPCYGGMLNETCFLGFMKWAQTANELGLTWHVKTLVNESLISRGRNTLTSMFLEESDATHLFFVDSDVGFEPWNVLVALNHNVDVIGGLYPMKGLPIKWAVNGMSGEESDENYLLKVERTGTGFMCIKRKVFKKLNKHPKVIPFKNDIGIDKKYDPHMKTYFDTDVRDGRYYSEDWTFCENWRDMGGDIFVDTRILLSHQGTYNFNIHNDNELREIYQSSNKDVVKIGDGVEITDVTKPLK